MLGRCIAGPDSPRAGEPSGRCPACVVSSIAVGCPQHKRKACGFCEPAGGAGRPPSKRAKPSVLYAVMNPAFESPPQVIVTQALTTRPADPPRQHAGHFTESMGTSGQRCRIFRVATETMGTTAQRCIIVHYYAGFRPQNVHKGCRNASQRAGTASQRARSRRLCTLQIFVSSLRSS